ncbi:MAG: 2'-5' RNA ligase family protein [Bacteroidota bacterium]
METGLATNRSFSTPVNQFYEYLLVAHPDAEVYARVMEEKQWFTMQYKEAIAVKTKPHITVANFLAKEEMEATIIRWMHRIISNQNHFRVTLDKYSGFKPHTIYLRVQDHAPFQQLAKELKVVDQYVRGYGCPEMHLINRPHVTIARKLPESIYHQAEMEYAQKEFHASFEVSELVLLRRSHEFDGCKQVNVFGLRP